MLGSCNTSSSSPIKSALGSATLVMKQGLNLEVIAIGYVVEMALQQAFIFPLILDMEGSKGGAWSSGGWISLLEMGGANKFCFLRVVERK